MNCPDKASYFCKDGWGRSVARVGRVEGTAVSDILLDTGCTRTMVRGDLVPEENLLPGEAATVLCAHGNTVLYPLARVRIDVEGVGMEVRAAVSESLPMSVLLGTDVPELGRLLHSNPLVVHTKGMDHALVTTRAQSKRDSENRAEQERRQVGSGVRPRALAVEETKPQGEETGEGLAEIVESGGFFRHNGILYLRWTPREQPESSTVEQSVLPRQCRRAVLQLAHTTPLSGHLGKKKTAAPIMRRSYWPTLFRDVVDYCRSCTQCQKSSRRRVPRAPD